MRTKYKLAKSESVIREELISLVNLINSMSMNRSPIDGRWLLGQLLADGAGFQNLIGLKFELPADVYELRRIASSIIYICESTLQKRGCVSAFLKNFGHKDFGTFRELKVDL